MNKRIKEEREKFVNEVIESLEKGIIPWKANWVGVEGISNPITGTKYKGSNLIRLMIATTRNRYEDHRWITFNQAQKNGWNIKKGAKAVPIEIYSIYDKLKKAPYKEETTKSMSEEERKKYLRENTYMLSKIYHVFNGEQVDGMPKLNFKEKKIINYNEFNKMVKTSGVKVRHYGTVAYYSPTKDEITVPKIERFLTKEDYYSTLIHELGHATGHKSRLDRLEEIKNKKEYAKEELIAEFTSVFVQQNKGLKYTSENSKNYIRSWIEELKKDKNILFTSIKEADKATNALMQYDKGIKVDFSKFKEKNQNKGIER